jgi:hypothetical protein
MTGENGEDIDVKVRDRRTSFEDTADEGTSADEASGGAAGAAPGEPSPEATEPSTAGEASAEQQAATEEAYQEAANACAEPEDQQRPLPPVDFSTLVISIAQGALMNLGEIEDPETQQKTQNLVLARHNIDLLGLLQDKTRGNLDKEEQKLIENLLYDLRIKYVSRCKAS